MKLSVCITTYNRAKELDITLDSLYHQTRLPDELIISDDCSPDNTQEIVEKWRKVFPALIYNRNKTNLYMPGNLNAALNLAGGEYIANLHDADTFDPTLLEKWERALDQYPSAGFVFSGIGNWPTRSKSENGIILHDVEPFTKGLIFFNKNYLHKFSSIVWGTVMARRSAYKTLLPFDARFGFISDVDMWMRMCLEHDIAYVREPLIILDHSPTPERSFKWDRLETLKEMQEINIKRFYKDLPDPLEKELKIHRIITKHEYLRRIAGRIWHRDWPSIKEGMNLYFKL